MKHGFGGVLQVIVLLECPMTSKLPLLHRWVDILGCNIFVPDGIHDAFNMLEIPSSSRSKAPPQHHWPSSMFHSRQSILLVRFTSYSSRLQDVIVANGCCTKSLKTSPCAFWAFKESSIRWTMNKINIPLRICALAFKLPLVVC